MNKRIKEEWVNSLESGKYKQAIGVLRRNEDSFCCLGVLCDIYLEETNNVKWVNVGSNFYYLEGTQMLNSSNLPIEVYKWANITNKEENIIPLLARMNDSAKTFKEISEKIKELL